MKNVKNEKMLARSLNVVGAVALLGVVGGFYALVYQPLGNLREAQLGRIDQLKMLLTHSAPVKREHRQLREQLHAMRSAVESAGGRVPAEPLGNQFVRDVREVADTVGLTVVNHRVGPEERREAHGETEVSFRCHGSYASICRFLAEVEQLARITKVSNLEVHSQQNSAGYPFQVTFVLYYGVESNDIKEKRRVL